MPIQFWRVFPNVFTCLTLISHFGLDRDQSQGRQCASVIRHRVIFYVKLNECYWYQVDRDYNGYPTSQAQVYATPSATIEIIAVYAIC